MRQAQAGGQGAAQRLVRRVGNKIGNRNAMLARYHLHDIRTGGQSLRNKDFAQRRINVSLQVQRMHQIVLCDDPRIDHHPAKGQQLHLRSGCLGVRQPQVKVAHRGPT